MVMLLCGFVAFAFCQHTAFANPKLTVGENCYLGSGFDYQVGCSKASILSSTLVPCQSDSHAGPCIEVEAGTGETAYTRDVRSLQDYNSMVSTAMSAEGGGFGYKVSASVDYMRQSQTTEKTISFFLGQSGTIRTERVRGTQALKMGASARQLLDECVSPSNCSFIHQHGLHYIYSITYGRSFLGGFTLWDKTTSKSSSLDVMASFSASSVFFSASASASFTSQESSLSQQLDKYVNAKWVGGNAGISLDPSSPETLYQTYLAWQEASFDAPAAMTMEYRNWIDVPEVQEIVNAKGREIIDLFTPRSITQAATDYITGEWGKTQYAFNAVQHALAWNCVREQPGFQEALQQLFKKCTTHLSNIQSFEEADIIARQTEINTGDYSWFIAEDLIDQYRAIEQEHYPEGRCGYCEEESTCESWCCGDPSYGLCCSQFSHAGSCFQTDTECCSPDFSCNPGTHCHAYEKTCCGDGEWGCPPVSGEDNGACCSADYPNCCSPQGESGCCSQGYAVCVGNNWCCPDGHHLCDGDSCCSDSVSDSAQGYAIKATPRYRANSAKRHQLKMVNNTQIVI